MNNKRTLLYAGFFFLLVMLFHMQLKPGLEESAWKHFQRALSPPRDLKGQIAPDMTLPLLDGTSFRVGDHIGKKVIILNFFTTWCAPCKVEIPELNRFYNQHKEKNVLLFGINVQEQESVVKDFIKTHQVQYPVGLDEKADIMGEFDVRAYPTLVLIGIDGRIKLYESGAIRNADVSIGPMVEAQLKLKKDGQGISKEDTLEAWKGEKSKNPKFKEGNEAGL